MKIVIDIGNYTPHENDLLQYKNGTFKVVSPTEVLKEQDKYIVELMTKFTKLEKEVAEFKKATNEKINIIAKATKTILGE